MNSLLTTMPKSLAADAERFAAECPTITCCECGTVEPRGNKPLRDWVHCWRFNACRGCVFWFEKVERRDAPHVARIDGAHYQIGDEPSQWELERWRRDGIAGWFCGFGGRRHVIRFADGREVVTHNLWMQGEIPDRWRERLPDNATWAKGR